MVRENLDLLADPMIRIFLQPHHFQQQRILWIEYRYRHLSQTLFYVVIGFLSLVPPRISFDGLKIVCTHSFLNICEMDFTDTLEN